MAKNTFKNNIKKKEAKSQFPKKNIRQNFSKKKIKRVSSINILEVTNRVAKIIQALANKIKVAIVNKKEYKKGI